MSEHAAQIAFQVLLGHLHDLVLVMPEKSFDGVVADLRIRAHLHIGNRLNVQGSPAMGVGIAHFHNDRQQGHIHAPCRLQDRFHEGPTTIGNHSIALGSLALVRA